MTETASDTATFAGMEQAVHPNGTFLVHGKLWVATAEGGGMPLDLVKTEHWLEDQMVRKIIAFAKPLSAEIARFKQHTRADIAEFDRQLEAKYGLVKRGRAGKGNQQYKTIDGLMMVETRVNDVTEFGPQLQVAKGLLDECLQEWTAEGRAEIQAIVTRAFNTDQAGKINKNAIIALTKIDSDDPRWQQAMEAIHDGGASDRHEGAVEFQLQDRSRCRLDHDLHQHRRRLRCEMKRMEFEVTTRVVVIIDETKLQPLMADFNKGITDFGEGEDAILQHGEHIARLTAVGEDFWPSDFVEGYGVVKDAGIDVTIADHVQIERIPSVSEMAGV